MATWVRFVEADPQLAAFGKGRLLEPPAYLATIRVDGRPRVHPVTPILAGHGLFLFMEPASPKGRDLRERAHYSLHNGVPDTIGTGGEFSITGLAHPVDDPDVRSLVIAEASYAPENRYVLFELGIHEARANGYGDVTLPVTRRWNESTR